MYLTTVFGIIIDCLSIHTYVYTLTVTVVTVELIAAPSDTGAE